MMDPMDKEVYDSLDNEADKKLYAVLENVFANNATRQTTNREAIRDEVGPISEKMMEHLVSAVYVLCGQLVEKHLEDDKEPIGASAYAVFDIFREGVRVGKKFGIEEGLKMPRLEDI